MSFILYLIAGFVAGVLGGMGMGGGTVLIPVLTIFLGVNQRIAQATNLLAFLPMASCVLPSHAKKGLIVKDNFLEIVIPAAITTAIGSIVAAIVPVEILKKLFGWFLIGLAVKQLVTMLSIKRRAISGALK